MHDKQTTCAHPNPKDRNRSIIWARFALDSTEWVILSARITQMTCDAGLQPLVSFALLGPGGKVLMETLIKTNELGARDAIEGHGIDYAVLMKAQTYQDAIAEIKQRIERKQVLCWDTVDIRQIFSLVAAANNEDAFSLPLISVGEEYGRFLGDLRPGTSSYQLPELKREKSALDEAKNVLLAIIEMAGSNQYMDSAGASPMGWTGEFYRPKTSPAEKIKGFLGIE
ncbi:MAG: hypothetical protein IT342_01990 [Candidatus Melainabacteria bacterium]|nr:hypothetical protein [Candidatus Melainabacteria bacterium]